MITIQREDFSEEKWCDAVAQWRDATTMLEAHRSEVSTLPGRLDLNVPLYVNAGAKGALILVTARDDGKPIGYSTCWFGVHPQCKQFRVAQGDTIYVDPRYRGRMIGLHIMRFMMNELKASSPLIVRYGSKIKADISPMLKHIGFELDEHSYILRL